MDKVMMNPFAEVFKHSDYSYVIVMCGPYLDDPAFVGCMSEFSGAIRLATHVEFGERQTRTAAEIAQAVAVFEHKIRHLK